MAFAALRAAPLLDEVVDDQPLVSQAQVSDALRLAISLPKEADVQHEWCTHSQRSFRGMSGGYDINFFRQWAVNDGEYVFVECFSCSEY